MLFEGSEAPLLDFRAEVIASNLTTHGFAVFLWGSPDSECMACVIATLTRKSVKRYCAARCIAKVVVGAAVFAREAFPFSFSSRFSAALLTQRSCMCWRSGSRKQPNHLIWHFSPVTPTETQRPDSGVGRHLFSMTGIAPGIFRHAVHPAKPGKTRQNPAKPVNAGNCTRHFPTISSDTYLEGASIGKSRRDHGDVQSDLFVGQVGATGRFG